ncbi:MAG TPA: TM2 domain-containing protein [Ferruginibacter sp.]|nr:TM2 domain-containing protein [Ferruginibacter sp.]HRO07106.1 TM2 domain-containing protein [Ferruginibacter sp.]HRP49785.1 TM2 domain-containing protein [Ferruginibacter sp.]
MRNFKIFVLISIAFVSLSSFKSEPINKSFIEAEVKAAKVAQMIADASADGFINYKELKSIVREAKGSKLNVGEKVVLKITKKKLSKNLMASNNKGSAGGKNQIVAALLCFFLGGLGIHRFYLGYTWQGIVQLLTLGGLGIWALIDLVRILMGTLKPKNGEYEKTI